jgi:hypothetical protein
MEALAAVAVGVSAPEVNVRVPAPPPAPSALPRLPAVGRGQTRAIEEVINARVEETRDRLREAQERDIEQAAATIRETVEREHRPRLNQVADHVRDRVAAALTEFRPRLDRAQAEFDRYGAGRLLREQIGAAETERRRREAEIELRRLQAEQDAAIAAARAEGDRLRDALAREIEDAIAQRHRDYAQQRRRQFGSAMREAEAAIRREVGEALSLPAPRPLPRVAGATVDMTWAERRAREAATAARQSLSRTAAADATAASAARSRQQALAEQIRDATERAARREARALGYDVVFTTRDADGPDLTSRLSARLTDFWSGKVPPTQ